MNNQFPELNNEEWDRAIESSTSQGQQGLARAMHLVTIGISNSRSQIGTSVGYLNNKIERLNEKIEKFNESSGKLTEKALGLTTWIMIAAMVSSLATAIIAIDIVVKWFK